MNFDRWRVAQAGESDRALQAFRSLQRSGMQPNLVTWCARRPTLPYRHRFPLCAATPWASPVCALLHMPTW